MNILSASVILRPGLLSTVIHENRHTRQPNNMSTYDREYEAHSYQRKFSSYDVQQKIDGMINSIYTSQGKQPPLDYDLSHYIKDAYGTK